MTMTVTSHPHTVQPYSVEMQASAEYAQRPPAKLSISALLAAALSLAVVLLLVVVDGDAAAADVGSVSVPDTISVHVVQPGDTLWGIAREMAGPDADIRPLVEELKVIAGGSNLQIGQRLIVDSTTLSHNS